MTATYDLIASNVLTSTTNTVTFSSISSSYRDLVFVTTYSGTGSGSNNVGFRFNGDNASNYFSNWLAGTGSNPTAFNSNDNNFRTNWASNVNSGFNWNTVIQIFDYSQTNKHKTVTYRNNVAESGGGETTLVAGRWLNQSAINSITFFATNFNFPIGSTFHLYGIVS